MAEGASVGSAAVTRPGLFGFRIAATSAAGLVAIARDVAEPVVETVGRR